MRTDFMRSFGGGEGIHIGLYENETDTIFDSSRRTVEKMASLIIGLDSKT